MENLPPNRRGEVAAGVCRDIQSLANEALLKLVEIAELARAFPEVRILVPQLHVAQANIAWVRDDLDGHGRGTFNNTGWPLV